jgi:hypothetical protein
LIISLTRPASQFSHLKGRSLCTSVVSGVTELFMAFKSMA